MHQAGQERRVISEKMIEQVLHPLNMRAAYDQVVSNRGSAGVDGMSVQALMPHLQKNWSELSGAIRRNEYVPEAILGVNIPKPNGRQRLLGIPTVTDRLLQQAVTQVLSVVFEPGFCEHSYGFRPGRNAHQAVQQAQRNINEGYQHIVDIDLKSFFDEVDHCLLLNLLHRKVKCPVVMRLVRKWLKAPILKDGKLTKRRKGVPQGGPLSPLLSNIVLNELDKELESRDHRYVRYADDFSIYVRSKTAARRVGNSIYLFLKNKLKLPINREKSGIRRPVQFKVLGYGFVPTYRKGEKGKYQLVVADKAWKRFKRALKHLTRKTTPVTFDERMAELKQCFRGWLNYFHLASIKAKLQKLDNWLCNRIRYCIWHFWKRPERKRKNLIRLGVEHGKAYAWSRTRMGGWAVAQSPILRSTITRKLLEKRGHQSLLAYYAYLSDA